MNGSLTTTWPSTCWDPIRNTATSSRQSGVCSCGLGPVTFRHATAPDDNEFITVDSPISHYQAAFAGVPAQTVVTAHTHMPFDRLAGTPRIPNPRPLGPPYEHPRRPCST